MLMPITRRVTRISLLFVFLFLWIGFSSADSDCPEEGYWACNAESYVGDKKDGIPHGKGKFTWKGGAWYEGEVRDGKINGQGTLVAGHESEGGPCTYVGTQKDGKLHGKGSFSCKNGFSYVGEYQDDYFHGQGTATYLDGSKFVGEFKDGNPWDGKVFGENWVIALVGGKEDPEETKRLMKKEEEKRQLAEDKRKKSLNSLLATKQCQGCDLIGVELRKANLSKANLSEADLSWANLSEADLSEAELSGANLTGIRINNKAIATNSTLKQLAEEKKRLAEEKRKEKERLAKEKRKLELEKIALNPGFRDLKPGLTREEIRMMKVCYPLLSSDTSSTCYDVDNIKFGGGFKGGVLRILTIDLGPYAGGGFLQSIAELGEDDPLLNMRGTLGKKYKMDYDYNERDRQLFNEGEKKELYTVFANGQVALLVIRIKKDYSSEIRSYIAYRDPSIAKSFLERNRPKRATSSDF